MRNLIYEGKLSEDPKFKEFLEKNKPKSDKAYNIFKLTIPCINGVNELFKNKDFKTKLRQAEADQNQVQEQSVSVFNNLYKKILLQTKKQNILINEDSSKLKATVIKKDGKITIKDENGNDITKKEILSQIVKYIKDNKDKVISSKKFDNKINYTELLTKDKFLSAYDIFINTLDTFDSNIPGDPSELISKDEYNNILLKFLTEKKLRKYIYLAKKLKLKKQQIQNIYGDVAKTLAAGVAAKYLQYKNIMKLANDTVTLDQEPLKPDQIKKNYDQIFKGFNPMHDIVAPLFRNWRQDIKRGGVVIIDTLKLESISGKSFQLQIEKDTIIHSNDDCKKLVSFLQQGIKGDNIVSQKSYIKALRIIINSVKQADVIKNAKDEESAANANTALKRCDDLIKKLNDIK